MPLESGLGGRCVVPRATHGGNPTFLLPLPRKLRNTAAGYRTTIVRTVGPLQKMIMGSWPKQNPTAGHRDHA